MKMNESKSNNIEMNIKIYNFNDYNLTVVGDNEEPWFVGKEVAELLGYSDTKKAIQKFVEDDEKIFIINILKKQRGRIVPLVVHYKFTQWLT